MGYSADVLRLVGVMTVRNAADVVALSLLHHFRLGVDKFFVVDDGSSDTTPDVLAEVARRHPLEWSRRDDEYRPRETLTALARAAVEDGADWILPVDADEFWVARGGLRRRLALTCAGALKAPVVLFVQQRERLEAVPEGLLTMTWRVGEPVCKDWEAAEMVNGGKAAYVEAEYPPKCIVRATPGIVIPHGNHWPEGTVGTTATPWGLVCLHAPLRARSVLDRRVEHGERVEAAAMEAHQSWQARRWRRLGAEGKLDEEWRANSQHDGFLDLGDRRKPLVRDTRLADLVRPLLEQPRRTGVLPAFA